MTGKKNTAPSAGTPGAETKRKFNIDDSISDMPKVVKRCTKVYEMNQTEKGYIRAVWRYAKTKEQLVTELKKLKFCTYSTAVEYLRMTDYIDDEDMQMLKGEEKHE